MSTCRICRPKYDFTLYFEGKSDDWINTVETFEEALTLYKRHRISVNDMCSMIDFMLTHFYTRIDKEVDVITWPRNWPSHRVKCKIMNGENIRVFTDGSSE